jgi:cell wall-associated NlpC family hydrolase
MTTIGWVFIAVAIFLFRQVSQGRVGNIVEDLGDAFTAIVSGDSKTLSEVVSRTGTSNDAVLPATEGTAGQSGLGATGLLAAAKRRGAAAKGYRLGATGPDYYDCSGLVWQAMKDVGAYKGARFTTRTFTSQVKSVAEIPASNAGPEDIVLWVNRVPGHMGIVSGKGRFYSALSSRSGIKDAPISVIKGTPKYYRVNGGSAGEGANGGGGGPW